MMISEPVNKLNKTKFDGINYHLFDMILKETNFTKCSNSLEALKLFYEQLYTHVIITMEDEVAALQKETGRLIIEWDTERRAKEQALSEIESLREQIQGQGKEVSQADPED